MVRRRTAEAAADDGAVPFARQAVADAAIDIESLAAAGEQLRVDRDGNLPQQLSRGLAGEKGLVLVERTPRHRAGDQRPGGLAVRKKVAGFQRIDPRLVVHVAMAAHRRDKRRGQQPARSPHSPSAVC